MKRTTILLLPLLFLVVSCGNLAQLSSQKYFDSIYGIPASSVQQEEVVIYSSEDFERMAAAKIAEAEMAKSSDKTVYIIVEDDDSWLDDAWFLYGASLSLYNNWYWHHPYYYRYHHSYYYSPYYSPYYYRSWFYDPWDWRWHHHHYYWDYYYWDHYHWHNHHYHPGGHYRPSYPKPGLSPGGRRYWGSRNLTQPATSPNSTRRPNASAGRRPNTNTSYGSAGSSMIGGNRGSTVAPQRPQNSGNSGTVIRNGNYNPSRVSNGSGASGAVRNDGQNNPVSRGTTGTSSNVNSGSNVNRSNSSSSNSRNSYFDSRYTSRRGTSTGSSSNANTSRSNSTTRNNQNATRSNQSESRSSSYSSGSTRSYSSGSTSRSSGSSGGGYSGGGRSGGSSSGGRSGGRR